jgi:hypothetical protein
VRIHKRFFFAAVVIAASGVVAGVSLHAQKSDSVAARVAAQNAIFEEKYKADLRNFPERSGVSGGGRKTAPAGISADGNPAIWRRGDHLDFVLGGDGRKRKTRGVFREGYRDFRAAQRGVGESGLAYGFVPTGVTGIAVSKSPPIRNRRVGHMVAVIRL